MRQSFQKLCDLFHDEDAGGILSALAELDAQNVSGLPPPMKQQHPTQVATSNNAAAAAQRKPSAATTAAAAAATAAAGPPSAPFYYYKDYSTTSDPDPSTPVTAPGRIPNFPAKMYAILCREDLQDIVSWLPHGRSWKIHKPREFEIKVIPAYFEHSKFSSFIRQANGWGFRRMIGKGPDRNSYYHEMFLRSLPHLVKLMKRPPPSSKPLADASTEPDLGIISQQYPVPELKKGNADDAGMCAAVDKSHTGAGAGAGARFIPNAPSPSPSSQQHHQQQMHHSHQHHQMPKLFHGTAAVTTSMPSHHAMQQQQQYLQQQQMLFQQSSSSQIQQHQQQQHSMVASSLPSTTNDFPVMFHPSTTAVITSNFAVLPSMAATTTNNSMVVPSSALEPVNMNLPPAPHQIQKPQLGCLPTPQQQQQVVVVATLPQPQQQLQQLQQYAVASFPSNTNNNTMTMSMAYDDNSNNNANGKRTRDYNDIHDSNDLLSNKRIRVMDMTGAATATSSSSSCTNNNNNIAPELPYCMEPLKFEAFSNDLMSSHHHDVDFSLLSDVFDNEESNSNNNNMNLLGPNDGAFWLA